MSESKTRAFDDADSASSLGYEKMAVPNDLATIQRVQSSLPAGFNPAAHPVIARHVFGVEPFPIGQAASEVVADMRFRRTTPKSAWNGPIQLAQSPPTRRGVFYKSGISSNA